MNECYVVNLTICCQENTQKLVRIPKIKTIIPHHVTRKCTKSCQIKSSSWLIRNVKYSLVKRNFHDECFERNSQITATSQHTANGLTKILITQR